MTKPAGSFSDVSRPNTLAGAPAGIDLDGSVQLPCAGWNHSGPDFAVLMWARHPALTGIAGGDGQDTGLQLEDSFGNAKARVEFAVVSGVLRCRPAYVRESGGGRAWASVNLAGSGLSPDTWYLYSMVLPKTGVAVILIHDTSGTKLVDIEDGQTVSAPPLSFDDGILGYQGVSSVPVDIGEVLFLSRAPSDAEVAAFASDGLDFGDSGFIGGYRWRGTVEAEGDVVTDFAGSPTAYLSDLTYPNTTDLTHPSRPAGSFAEPS